VGRLIDAAVCRGHADKSNARTNRVRLPARTVPFFFRAGIYSTEMSPRRDAIGCDAR